MPLDGTDQHDTPLDGQVEGRYTILEAAKALNVHKNTIRHRIATGVYESEMVLTPNGEAYVIPAHYIEAELAAIASGHVKARGQGTAQGYPRLVGQSESTAVSAPEAFEERVHSILAPLVDEIRDARRQATEAHHTIGQEQGLRQAAEQREREAVAEARKERDRARDLERALEAERRKGPLQRLFTKPPKTVQ